MDGLNRITTSIDKVIVRSIKALTKHFGVLCEVYAPKYTDSVYGVENSSVTYDSEPVINGVYLITGLTNKVSKALEVLDPFYEDGVKLYTESDVILENNSLVRITLRDNETINLKLDHSEVVNGTNFFRYYLVPMV